MSKQGDTAITANKKVRSQLTEGMCVLYPAGGKFNKLRQEQHHLRLLMESSLHGYNNAQHKGTFIQNEILARIPGGLHICTRDGTIFKPTNPEAKEKIMQIMRDLRKRVASDTVNGVISSTNPSRGAIEYIIYPAGGKFNKIRQQNPLMANLLRCELENYTRANNKRGFIEEKILNLLPDGLKVCNKDGVIWTPTQAQAVERIAQRFRDMRKEQAKQPKKKNFIRGASEKQIVTPSSLSTVSGASAEPGTVDDSSKKRKSPSPAGPIEEGERNKIPRHEEEDDDEETSRDDSMNDADDDKEPLDQLQENENENNNTKDLIEWLRNMVASQKETIEAYEQNLPAESRQREQYEDQLQQRVRQLELEKQTAQHQLQELHQKYQAIQAENEFLIDREVEKQVAAQQQSESSETRRQEQEQEQEQEQQQPMVQPRNASTPDAAAAAAADTETDKLIISMQLEIKQLRELLLWQGSTIKEQKKRTSVLLDVAATDDGVAAAAAPAAACSGTDARCRELKEQCQKNEAEIQRLETLVQELRQKELQSLTLFANEKHLYQQCKQQYEACVKENVRLHSSVVQFERGFHSVGQAQFIASQQQVVLLQSTVRKLKSQLSSLKKDQEEPEQKAAAVSPPLISTETK